MSLAIDSQYPVYWAIVKYPGNIRKPRPVIVVDRHGKNSWVRYVSQSIETKLTICFLSTTGKLYNGYIQDDVHMIGNAKLIRFIGKIDKKHLKDN